MALLCSVAPLILPTDVFATVFPWLPEDHFSADHIPSLFGKVAIVTGGNRGVGYETAKQIALQGAMVVIACRSRHRCQRARDEIANALGEKGPGSGMVLAMDLDLASLHSVRAFVADFKFRFKRLDILVNNAGVLMFEPGQLTADNLEIHFGTNHVGPQALTMLLLDYLVASQPSRVVMVSSTAHRFVGGLLLSDRVEGAGAIGGIGYAAGGWAAHGVWSETLDPALYYGFSKLGNILFAKELSARMAKQRG